MPLSNILRQTVSIAVMLTVSQLISCAYGQQTTNAAARTLSPEVAVNGCGSGKFIINKGLRAVGESVLIDCCNQHDVCYGSCKQRSLCDYEFNQCLSDECQKLPLIRRKICEMDKIGMVMAVRVFGNMFYCRSGPTTTSAISTTDETSKYSKEANTE